MGGRQKAVVAWSPEAEDRFFESLAASCNVTLACKEAKVSSGGVYRRRRKEASFRLRWGEALATGDLTGILKTTAVTTMQLNRGGAGEQGQGRFFGAAMRAIGTPLNDAEIDGMVAWFAAKQGRTL